MGRELERRGAPFQQPEWSALAMMKAPGTVKEIHKDYIRSGAQVIMTNSYALVPFHIGEERFREQGKSLADSAGQAARAAVEESRSKTLVAASIPPLFGSYRADLYEQERVVEIASPLIQGLAPYADLWLCETESLLDEPRRVKSLIDKLAYRQRPFWVSFTLEDTRPTTEPLLRSGEPVVEAVTAMAAIGVDAILFNCCQPEVVGDAIQTTRTTLTSLDAREISIGAYANGFPPQPKGILANEELTAIREDMTPAAYLEWALQWRREGATLIGGCCGIGPEHIAMLAEKISH